VYQQYNAPLHTVRGNVAEPNQEKKILIQIKSVSEESKLSTSLTTCFVVLPVCRFVSKKVLFKLSIEKTEEANGSDCSS